MHLRVCGVVIILACPSPVFRSVMSLTCVMLCLHSGSHVISDVAVVNMRPQEEVLTHTGRRVLAGSTYQRWDWLPRLIA